MSSGCFSSPPSLDHAEIPRKLKINSAHAPAQSLNHDDCEEFQPDGERESFDEMKDFVKFITFSFQQTHSVVVCQ